MNTALLILIVFLILLTMGLEVGFAVTASALAAAVMLKIPVAVVAQRYFTAVDSFSLMAIPLFMVAGSIMSKGSLTKRIIDFTLSFMGNVKGALCQVVAISGMIMGGISGSGVADTAALGALLHPEMKRKKYDPEFSAALIAASGSIGLIIPPSVAMIIYGVTTQSSIGDLFIAGIVPGVLISLAFMLYSFVVAHKEHYPVEGSSSWAERWDKFKKAIFSLIMPLIIIIGIRGGFFTPTEGGAIISAYALLVSMFIYKDIKLADLPEIFFDAALSTATIALIICGTSLLTWILAYENIPQMLTQAVLSLTDNKIILIILIQSILLLTGMVIDSGPAIMLLAPILAPIAKQIGMSSVQFGLMMVISLTTGLLTPPVGTAMYVSSNISKIPVQRLAKRLVPFVLIMTVMSLLIAIFPIFSEILL
ncbi:TRAP transporter large permease [Murdochiella vaginalis]|uniref:TRAP transporter large permease n=1 Tax=Murdochiella vaginalis TaxID=1852373 RepID=UPI0008FDDC38|nr:TRAP transporter large permease [Murdochiella vaginalis]